MYKVSILRNVFAPLFLIVFIISPLMAAGPDGYTLCAREGQSYTLPGTCHVAYGANGSFAYRYNVTGTITFNNAAFGDPAPGWVKSGYYKLVDITDPADILIEPLNAIRDHLNGSAPLTETQIMAYHTTIEQNIFVLNNDLGVLQTAIEIIQLYETNRGALFLNSATSGSFNATPSADGKSIHRAVFTIQQGVFDQSVNDGNLVNYPVLIGNLKYKTADWFPGHAAPPADPGQSYTVKINASMPTDWGRRTSYSQTTLRRPTGCYLAPGSLATVTVPAGMVNTGFRVLVGAHTWDKTANNPKKRFDRVSKSYGITSTQTKIANPFGGGIYIEVPYQANAGLVDITFANVIRSPFYSNTTARQTTASDWNNIEKHCSGPWADFQTERFMLQVPTSWISQIPDVVSLMAKWDTALDGVSDLLGYPHVRNNVILYLQPDISLMGSAYYPGYPQSNNVYTPNKTYNINTSFQMWPLRDPMGFSIEYHELGHAQLIPGFYGETESAVHLPYTYVQNEVFGVDLDTAFNNSCGGEQGVWTLDSTARYWMARNAFRAGQDMALLNYEHTGHAKYVEIAKMFGWDVIKDFYYEDNLITENNLPGDGLSNTDSRIYRLSKAAGCDLTPLIHFWGRKPDKPSRLRAMISEANLPPSAAIYNRLMYYKSIIPPGYKGFVSFINELYPNGSQSNSDGTWGYLWMVNTVAPIYDSAYAQSSKQALQNIVDTYFTPYVNFIPYGDFEPDGDVDISDFTVLAAAWMGDDPHEPVFNPSCDFDSSGVIDTGDLSKFSGDWLAALPTPAFADNFESSADWTGKWNARGQWNRSAARSFDGSYSAEIDGNVTDSALVSNPIDVSGRSTAMITFSWYIESGLDTGEYIAFDIDTGSGWVQKAVRKGNVDLENVWAAERIVVDVSGTNTLTIRFRGKMSGSDEDAYIDQVKVTAR